MKAGRNGFTLIELTIVLALISVFVGLVIVRFGAGSQRQLLIQNARKVGNLLRNYREKAIEEESLYALKIDLQSGEYTIVQPPEHNVDAVNAMMPIKTGHLATPVKFGKAVLQGQELNSPVILFLDRKGVLPEITLGMAIEGGPSIAVKPDSFINEVIYDER